MTYSSGLRFVALIALAAPVLPLLCCGPVAAQTVATGTIAGRVTNSRTAQSLENARVVVVGTGRSTFTDDTGGYRLPNVPAGTVKLEVFYTGFETRTDTVTVSPGQTTRHDVDLGGTQTVAASKDRVVELARFVVATTKEMAGAAIAINEQRFAANIKNVIAADEFGTVAEGNVAAFMKFLPGVSVDTDANAISINGVPSQYTPVTVAGFDLASAGQSGTSRVVEVDQASTNNIARVEVVHSPTPESPGSALAGSVNLVPHSAFGRTKPLFTISTFVTMRGNAVDFGKTPGPRREPTRKVLPGFDFTYIRPVNERIGFTVTGGASQSYLPTAVIQNTWTGAGAATNGGALPDTTPGNPYLTAFNVRDGTNTQIRASAGTTVDYKLGRDTRFSFSLQYAFFGSERANRLMTFNVNRVAPGDFSGNFTHGAPGAGDLRLQNVARERSGRTLMPTFVFRHNGPIWSAEAGAGLSQATNQFRDLTKGYFNNSLALRTGVTVAFDDISYLRPGRITVADGATALPLDPFKVSNYAVSTTNGDSSDSIDVKRRAYASLKRDFSLLGAPLSLKGGLDLRESVRDLRGQTTPFTFVGRDGRASTTPVGNDDGATPFLDANFSQRGGLFGLPPIQWLSNEQLWEYFGANPAHFTTDESTTYINAVNLSKRAQEAISAAYLRADLQFLDNRLKLVGGVRAEQTNIQAEGPLNDPTLNFQRDGSGKYLLGSNGRPLPISTTTLAVTQRTRIDRGNQAEKEYLRWLPSINASYNIRENLIARLAYYHSLGRPDFNQYAGPLTLPDVGLGPTATNRITVNNAGIKAWSAQTTKLSLEHYFENVGVVSVGAFRRDFENFFETTIFPANPEFLALYELDPDVYSSYLVSTQRNAATTLRMAGAVVNYKQALTFLPPWARGVQVFANASFQRAVNEAVFNDFAPRIYSWGVSLTRQKFNLNVNWFYRSDLKRANVAVGRSIEPDTYLWVASTLAVDVAGEYRLGKRFAVFASARNLIDKPAVLERYGPGTPAYAKLRQYDQTGALLSFGVKGTF